jgi:hypothetical protein
VPVVELDVKLGITFLVISVAHCFVEGQNDPRVGDSHGDISSEGKGAAQMKQIASAQI